jgi:hypothetical protein
VIFMLRDLDEVLASQREMLRRRGTATPDSDDGAMRRHLETHLRKLETWLAERPNFRVLYCHYGELLRAPGTEIERIRKFLGCPLDENAMALAIDPKLHRNRAGVAQSPAPGSPPRTPIHPPFSSKKSPGGQLPKSQ